MVRAGLEPGISGSQGKRPNHWATLFTPYSRTCQQSLTSMLLTFRNLPIPIAGDKTQGPCTALEFMGIILDSEKMEARLPPVKVERIQTSLASFQRRKSCTLMELQSLIGTLNFACKIIPPGRPFLQRMIALTRKVSKSHHHISLGSGFFKDLHMSTPGSAGTPSSYSPTHPVPWGFFWGGGGVWF